MKQKNIKRILQGVAVLLMPVIFFLLSTLPATICIVVILMLIASFVKMKQLGFLHWLITVFQLLVLLIAGIGISAPFRALTLLIWKMTDYPIEKIRDFSPSGLQFLLSVWPDLPADAILGWSGAATFFLLGLASLITLEKQARQFENLPTADVSSVPIGLAELRGKARFAEWPRLQTEEESSGGSIPQGHILYYQKYQDGDKEKELRHWSTFYLEDKTGRILVDPRKVEFWNGSWGLSEPLAKIWLTRRQTQTVTLNGSAETRTLEDGDPISVIGSVEIDRDALPDAKDANRLVIRPSSGERKRSLLERFFVAGEFMKGIVRGREYRHIFFLADAGEEDITDALNRAKLQALGWTGLCLGLSLLLAVTRL